MCLYILVFYDPACDLTELITSALASIDLDAASAEEADSSQVVNTPFNGTALSIFNDVARWLGDMMTEEG